MYNLLNHGSVCSCFFESRFLYFEMNPKEQSTVNDLSDEILYNKLSSTER